MRAAVSAEEAARLVPDGASVMIGGFLAVGSPRRIIDALVARGARGLAIIGKLIEAGCVARAVVSRIGTNPATQKKMLAGEIEVELVPQGTLAERIRAAGAGLRGVLTPTGIGTEAANGRQVLELDHGTFLLEAPLRADVALMHAREADHFFNLAYRLTATNFNPLMAMAAARVIAEAEEIVPTGTIPADAVRTSGALVDHLVERPRRASTPRSCSRDAWRWNCGTGRK